MPQTSLSWLPRAVSSTSAIMKRFIHFACCFVVIIVPGILADSPLVMSLMALPDARPGRDFVSPRDERTIDLQTKDVNKQLAEEQDSKFKSAIKRKHADHRVKHPFLITKEDIENQDSVVEDNIIVESNVLHLNKRVNNELARSRRVKRGWNLQHVIVPDDPIYHRVSPAESRRWTTNNVMAGRSKLLWADSVPKKTPSYHYRSWGAGVQDLHGWPTKLYG